MKFFFDYIYYRITQFYFKWDGRTGITAIVAICMIELMLLTDITLLVFRLVNGKNERQMYPGEKWLFVAAYIGLFIYNYRKYNKTYTKYRQYWKDESRGKRIYKGLFVILSLVIPWILAFWIGFDKTVGGNSGVWGA